ncbi:MAG: hypothetical protein ABI414_16845, partial [Devosia sp.]
LCLLVLPDHVFAEGNGNNGNGNNGNGNGNSDNNHGNGNNGNGNGNNGGSGDGSGAVSAERLSSAPEPAVELSENAALQAVEAGKAVPLQSLLPDVKSRTGGEIINAQLQQVGGSLLYAIKVLTPDGKVMAEYYDARTGRHVE